MDSLDRRQFIKLVGGTGIPFAVGFPNISFAQTSKESPAYTAKDYSKLLGMPGQSPVNVVGLDQGSKRMVA